MITHGADAGGCGWVGASFTSCAEPATWIHLDGDGGGGGWAFCDVHARRTAVTELLGAWARRHRTTGPPDPTDTDNDTDTESTGVTS